MATITESRPPVQGQQHSYSITPAPGPGCVVTWFINGQKVNLRDQVGGLEVKGFGASGTMTVEVIGNVEGTRVAARVDCPERPPLVAGPIIVGSGSFNTCEQEPCKSSRQDYINSAFQAFEAERDVQMVCGLYTFLVRLLGVLFLVLIFLIALSIICRMGLFFPTFCLAIDIMVMTLGAGLLAASARALLLRRELHRVQTICLVNAALVRLTYLQMQDDCPPDCWAPKVKINCKC